MGLSHTDAQGSSTAFALLQPIPFSVLLVMVLSLLTHVPSMPCPSILSHPLPTTSCPSLGYFHLYLYFWCFAL